MHRKGGYIHLTGTRKTICFFLFLLFIVSIVFSGSGNCAQVTLAWDRNTEIDLARYKIYYGTGSRVYNWFIDVGNFTSYTVTGLADGSTYFFAATAYDTSNIESTYSGEVSYITNSTTGCDAAYSCGEQVTLSARPDFGSTFLGWQPASKCSGTGSCVVHIDKNITVKAIFSGPE